MSIENRRNTDGAFIQARCLRHPSHECLGPGESLVAPLLCEESQKVSMGMQIAVCEILPIHIFDWQFPTPAGVI